MFDDLSTRMKPSLSYPPQAVEPRESTKPDRA